MPPKGTELAPIAQELGQKMTQFEAALLGSGISPKKFIRVIMTAIQLNPDLLACDRRSLMNAAMKAASDGLVPDGHDGALVPFDDKVTWMPMIAGVRKKVRRAGEVTAWDVTAVFAKDKFDFELGDDPFIKHKPWNPPPLEKGAEETEQAFTARLRKHVDHGPVTHVYSVATIKGGDKSRDVMSRAEVELVRDMYARKNRKGEYSPAWRKSFAEMAKKTVARRHAKQLPMSTDILGLLSRDDELYDLQRERADRIQAPRELSARLDFLAGVDSETGEFAETEDGANEPASTQRDGRSTPPSPSAVSDDVSGSRHPDAEEAAPPSEPGADFPPASGERDERIASEGVAPQPEPAATATAGSTAPPGAAQPPGSAPGGSRKAKAALRPDLLTPSIEQRGAEMAQKSREELERWVNELPPDEMARISLAQLKAWRLIADKVGA
jgi:recombination protein RecT